MGLNRFLELEEIPIKACAGGRVGYCAKYTIAAPDRSIECLIKDVRLCGTITTWDHRTERPTIAPQADLPISDWTTDFDFIDRCLNLDASLFGAPNIDMAWKEKADSEPFKQFRAHFTWVEDDSFLDNIHACFILSDDLRAYAPRILAPLQRCAAREDDKLDAGLSTVVFGTSGFERRNYDIRHRNYFQATMILDFLENAIARGDGIIWLGIV